MSVVDYRESDQWQQYQLSWYLLFPVSKPTTTDGIVLWIRKTKSEKKVSTKYLKESCY